ncbi:Rgg family transcriptional regulator [Streptococcus thermophilus]|nr:helix-turn-helix domain-containing protein [Streptococcus thermophilus]MCE2285576.1 helix-turn-helix domain-containing protein [Streptococcus thermophilus]
MDSNELLKLGEFYKELRIARKVKQKDVAKNKLSVSQLSKFESGQTMLSADKMLEVIEGINLTFSEFGFALRDYKPTQHQLLMNKISKLSAENDKQSLLKLLDKYKESQLLYDKLNTLVIKNAIHLIDRDFTLSLDDSKFLSNYLFDIEDWTAYEIHLFGNTMPFLSDTDLLFLGKELVPRSEIYSPLLDFRKALKYTYLNLISELVERRLTTHFNFFVNQLRMILDVFDTFEIILLNFLVLVYSYLIENSVNLEEVEQYILKVSEIEQLGLSKILEQRLSQYLRTNQKGER